MPRGYGSNDFPPGKYGNAPENDAYTLLRNVKALPANDEVGVERVLAIFKAESPYAASLRKGEMHQIYIPQVIAEFLEQETAARIQNAIYVARGLGFTDLATQLEQRMESGGENNAITCERPAVSAAPVQGATDTPTAKL